MGFCKFRTDSFDKKTFVNHKYVPIRGVDGANYWLGPVRLSLYAHLQLSNGAEMAATVDFADADSLVDGARTECQQGGRAGFGKAFMRSTFNFGGKADIWFFQAVLGASINFMSTDAGFSGELLQEGYGKEAVVGIQAISGYIRGVIYQRNFRCWLDCCYRCCFWGCWCCCYYINCESWWSTIWDQTFWSFNSGLVIPNMLCWGQLTRIG